MVLSKFSFVSFGPSLALSSGLGRKCLLLRASICMRVCRKKSFVALQCSLSLSLPPSVHVYASCHCSQGMEDALGLFRVFTRRRGRELEKRCNEAPSLAAMFIHWAFRLNKIRRAVIRDEEFFPSLSLFLFLLFPFEAKFRVCFSEML